MTRLIGVASILAALTGCGNGEVAATSQSLLPTDYVASYREVRNCRPSSDHDLNNIRILASPSALEPYTTRSSDFPEGAVVVKEEFEFGDTDCSGPPKQWTLMERSSLASAPLGWRWQQIDRNGRLVSEDAPRCVNCHTSCGTAPVGYEGTCAMP